MPTFLFKSGKQTKSSTVKSIKLHLLRKPYKVSIMCNFCYISAEQTDFSKNQTSGISSLLPRTWPEIKHYTIWQHFQTFMYHWRDHKHQEIYFCCCLLVSILTGNNNHCHNSALLLIFAIILQTFFCLVVETGSCSRFIDPPSPTHLLLSFLNVIINSRMGGKNISFFYYAEWRFIWWRAVMGGVWQGGWGRRGEEHGHETREYSCTILTAEKE